MRQSKTVNCCSGGLIGSGSGMGILGASEDGEQERRTRRITVRNLAELGGLGMGGVCSITMAVENTTG